MQCSDTRPHPGKLSLHRFCSLESQRLLDLPVVYFRDLGRQRSTIELDTACVTPAQVQDLEEAVNEKIRAHVPVTVQLLSVDDPAVEKVVLC